MKNVLVWVAAAVTAAVIQFIGIMPVVADSSADVTASGDQLPADAAAQAAPPAEEANMASSDQVTADAAVPPASPAEEASMGVALSDQVPADAAVPPAPPAEEMRDEPPVQGEEVLPPAEEALPAEEAPAPEEGQEIKDPNIQD